MTAPEPPPLPVWRCPRCGTRWECGSCAPVPSQTNGPYDQEAFGARLEAARRYYGKLTGRPRMKMSVFANELGVQAARYRRYERGEMQPSLSVLDAVRRLTKLSLDYLISDLPPGETAPNSRAGCRTMSQHSVPKGLLLDGTGDCGRGGLLRAKSFTAP